MVGRVLKMDFEISKKGVYDFHFFSSCKIVSPDQISIGLDD